MAEPAPKFEIEEMTADEIDEAAMMRYQSWLDTYVNEAHGVDKAWVREQFAGKFDPETKKDREKRFTEGKEAGTFNAWSARDRKGTIIGQTTPFITEDGTQRVGSIYVDSMWHGQGVGKQLMEKVVGWLDPDKPITLEVATYNERGKAFYRKWGFEEVPGSEKLIDDKLPVVIMKRQPQNERGEN